MNVPHRQCALAFFLPFTCPIHPCLYVALVSSKCSWELALFVHRDPDKECGPGQLDQLVPTGFVLKYHEMNAPCWYLSDIAIFNTAGWSISAVTWSVHHNNNATGFHFFLKDAILISINIELWDVIYKYSVLGQWDSSVSILQPSRPDYLEFHLQEPHVGKKNISQLSSDLCTWNMVWACIHIHTNTN